MRKKNTKLIITLISCLMVFSLTGCVEGNNKDKNSINIGTNVAGDVITNDIVNPTPEPTKEPETEITLDKPITVEKHQHLWDSATCVKPRTCVSCGLQAGNANGHDWNDATCYNPKTCKQCGATQGTKNEHAWVEATCIEPKHCANCSITEGSPLGHTGGTATCSTKAKCTRCGHEYGSYSNHTGGTATCVNKAVCNVCNKEYGNLASHTVIDATCTTNSYCSVCNKELGTEKKHLYADASCLEPRKCTLCEETEGEARGHIGGVPTCEKLAICTDCGIKYGEFAEHRWVDATCEQEKHCSVCNKIEDNTKLEHNFTEWTIKQENTCLDEEIQERKCIDCSYIENKTTEEALGHYWIDATCENAKTCDRCGLVEGEILNHNGGEATCTEKAICDMCNKPYGELKEHSFVGADCVSPRHCEICGFEDGKALGHSGDEASCEEGAVCSVCGETYIEALGHYWIDATCANLKICDRCGKTEGDYAEHKWVDATCEKDKYCSVCKKVEENSKKEHSFSEWNITQELTCEKDKIEERICEFCEFKETKETKAEGHTWIDATCENAKYCSKCNEKDGEALGHIGGIATTTEKAICERCQQPYGELLPEIKPEVSPEPEVTPEPSPEPEKPTNTIQPSQKVKYFTVYDLNTGKTVTDTEDNIIAQIVMNEMSGWFHEEALKAQAIAARSWMQNQYDRGGTAPQVGLKKDNSANYQNCVKAAEETRGIYVTYNDTAALTPYYAYSNGWSQSCYETWGGMELPYLVAVESKYDSEYKYFSVVKEISKEDVRNKLINKINGVVLEDGKENEWFKVLTETSGHYVDTMEVGGKTTYTGSSGKTYSIRGRTLYSWFNLRSPDFDIEYKDGKFYFTQYGWGHGCGMSQRGANYYANYDNMTYAEILAHYFPNTELKVLEWN